MKKSLGIVLALFVLAACGGDDPPTVDLNNGMNNGDNNGQNNGQNNGDNNGQNNGQNNGMNNGTIGTNNGTIGVNNGAGDCVPNEGIYDAIVDDILASECSQCHGATPAFGAPTSYINYADLIAGEIGERHVDKIVTRVADYTMPPASADRVTHNLRDTLVEWASCGETHPNHAAQLVANRDPHVAPPNPPAGSESVDFLADGYNLGVNEIDKYKCWIFEAPNDAAKFINRFEAVVDESRVLHHLTLQETNATSVNDTQCFISNGRIFYAWAPGGDALELPDGGLRIEPGQRFMLQIHYNNGAGVEDVEDNSGVRIHWSDTANIEYGLMGIGSGLPSMQVAPGERYEDTSVCNMTGDANLVIGFPHMHEIGLEFHETITRNGVEESLIDLTGWAFDGQPFYDYDVPISAGDQIRTTCVYENHTDSVVTGGLRTQDEMCFDFIYVTPPNANCF